MKFIKHRVNTISELKNLKSKYGVEVDLRSYKKEIILNHEPFEQGVLFEDWIKEYQHDCLILNIKEEGIEKKILSILEQKQIKNYFFLDQSLPMLIKKSIGGNKKTAIRFSSYESFDTVLKFKDLVDWIWIDYYEYYPLNKEIISHIKQFNLKTCLVSPELQGYSIESIQKAQHSIKSFISSIDAVCTKDIDLWHKFCKNN